MPTTRRTTCNRDCPDSCSILATVENGRIVAHRGDPEHGITQGFLCWRGNHYLERFYSPDRILHPQRKTRAGWQPLSWDDALDLCAEQLIRCRDDHGPLSALLVSYSGIHHWVARIMGHLFWAHYGGATQVEGGLSVEAVDAAQRLDFGAAGTHAPEDLVHSKAFVVWGKNVAVTRPHWLPFMKQARNEGAPLVVIDPLRCATAKMADRHYAIAPGTDGLLALGIGRLLLESGAIDQAFVDEHCNGFEAYRELALAQDLDAIAAATDLSRAAIEQLAELYATRRPLATMVGLGTGYWGSSGQTVRLIDALATVTGNVGVSGGGAQGDTSGAVGFDLSVFREAPRVDQRHILLPRLGQEIAATQDPPLSVGWVAGANPVATAPDTRSVVEGLSSLDFLVVVDQFMTGTAELADLVLPCTTYLEMDDLVSAYGHHWLGRTQQVVAPLGEAKPDREIYQLLAERLGFGEALAGSPELWLTKLLAPLAEHGVTPASLAERPQPNPLAPPVAFADRKFETASGKVELTSEPPTAPPALAPGQYHLVATKTLKMVNAQIEATNLPPEPVACVHPSRLTGEPLADGDHGWVTSKAGRVRALIRTDDTVRRDVLLLNPAAWQGDKQGVNQLREATLTDVGKTAAMHATCVTLEPAGARS
ncbi:MAG: molybdopterin-dependent oxidoreductase [Deltaproteobacteria bacterium]|nr:molybdopterin-dependent oxidoreductase [Deltaproteobacteria bacterium]